MTQGNTDSSFSGSIPALYHRYLGPLLFEPYAEEIARRAAALKPRDIIETAAGTGILTEALHRAVPDAWIIATDLNQAMLDLAAKRIGEGVKFVAADALELPFEDGSFDLAVCQFGVMFYPDRVKGNSEARRVLRDGGRYILGIWDRLEANPVSHMIQKTLEKLMPKDTPRFLERTPFGYHDKAAIERDLRAAGFGDITIETIAAKGRVDSPRDAARGLVAGSPLRAEIEARDPAAVDRLVDAVGDVLESGGELDTSLSAHIVTAVKD